MPSPAARRATARRQAPRTRRRARGRASPCRDRRRPSCCERRRDRFGNGREPVKFLRLHMLPAVDDERARELLAAVERAERRLAAGTYGVSVESGAPIPDERLEALPAAELTADEEQARR